MATNHDTEAVTLQERALAELQEQRALAEQRQREHEENQRRLALDSFGWRLRNNFGIWEYGDHGSPPDTTVTIDGVTLRYTQTNGSSARDGYVSMAVACSVCGLPYAWQTVEDLHDIGRVLSGERWGYSGTPICEACYQAREDAASEAVIEAMRERRDNPEDTHSLTLTAAQVEAGRAYLKTDAHVTRVEQEYTSGKHAPLTWDRYTDAIAARTQAGDTLDALCNDDRRLRDAVLYYLAAMRGERY